MRVYAWEDNILSSATLLHAAANSNPTHLTDWNPGRQLTLSDGFVIRQFGALSNHLLISRYPTGGTQFIDSIPAGGYTGSYLATVLSVLLSSHTPGGAASYSQATNLWTFSASAAFDLMWDSSDTTRRLADALGFAHANLTGATSYTGTVPVYCEDHLWLVYDLGLAYGLRQTEAVMIYAPTITGSQDTIRLFGHTSDLGEDWMDWESYAAYQGAEFSAWNSGINDLYVWLPDVTCRFWMVSLRCPAAATATTDRRIGVGGIWQSHWWDAADYGRNFSGPWTSNPTHLDVASRPAAGGAHHVGRVRGEHEITLPFRGLARTQAQELRRLATRWGKTPHLWVLDPDNVGGVWDAAAFAYIDGIEGPRYSGAQQYADMELSLVTVSMHPWE